MAKLKVLLVEDDLDIAAGIGDFLAAHGVTVDFAANATEARARVGADVFDVLVLDVNLPGMDGISLCAELKQTRGLRTPAIFLTARGELADKLRGFAAGGVDYMVKPFAPAELLARIRALTAHAAAAGGSRVCIDGYELDLSGAELRHGEQRPSLHASVPHGKCRLRRLSARGRVLVCRQGTTAYSGCQGSAVVRRETAQGVTQTASLVLHAAKNRLSTIRVRQNSCPSNW